MLALAGAASALWFGLEDWAGTATIAAIIERLLFVLMLVEILHTVRASMRSGGLSAEPFLIVGLIACIRRVLVSTLESTEATRAAASMAAAADAEAAFRASMIELGVLGFLILVMVVSIYLLRRARPHARIDLTCRAHGRAEQGGEFRLVLVAGHQPSQQRVAPGRRMEVQFRARRHERQQPQQARLVETGRSRASPNTLSVGVIPAARTRRRSSPAPGMQRPCAGADRLAQSPKHCGRLTRHAHAGQPVPRAVPQQQRADIRMQVHVLVRVGMRQRQAGRGEGFELGRHLA